MTRRIPLTQGKTALVDDDLFDYLNQWVWCAVKGKQGRYWYATAFVNGKIVFMHRLIAKPSKGFIVDHRDHNGLNNQRKNLRICTYAQNRSNSQSTSKIGYKGAYYDKVRHRWKASIKINQKTRHLGAFKTPEEAARAYDKAAREHFGEFASLNFSDE